MTLIELARLLIADKDNNNYLFNDDEIMYIVNRNIVHMMIQAEAVDTQNKIFDYGTYEVLPNNAKVFSPEGILIDNTLYTLLTDKHRVEFTQPTNYLAIVLDCDVIDVDNLRADAMELIAVDFRKLHNYSIQNVSGNLETAKEHVLRLARFFRRPRLRGTFDV